MKCPKCKTEVNPKEAICPNCNTHLVVTCPRCGSKTRIGSSSCSKCGFVFVKFCESCGSANYLSAKQCRKCSNPLSQTSTNSTAKSSASVQKAACVAIELINISSIKTVRCSPRSTTLGCERGL